MTDREKWSELMDEMCGLYKAWDYKAATVKGEAALALIDGLSTEEQATTLSQIVELYTVQGLYDRAETLCDPVKPLYERALEARKKLLGKEHLNVDNTQLDLAGYLDERRQEDVGRTLYRQAFSYCHQGQYSHAETLYKRVLEIREKLLGQEHPDVADILFALALTYHHQELYDLAKPLYERALEIWEKLLGQEHPDIDNIQLDRAVSHHDQGQYSHAEPLYERAKTDEKHLFLDITRSPSKRELIVRSEFLPFRRKLIHTGYVNAEQLKQALVDSQKNNISLIEVLEALTGKKLPIEVQEAYKKQRLFELKIVYGIDTVDIESTKISKVEIRTLINNFISVASCCQLKLLPIGITDADPPILTVAMLKPNDLQAKNELDKILRPHGIAWREQVVAPEDYQQLIDVYLDERRQEDADIILCQQAFSYTAKGQYEPALEIREKLLGQEHLDVDKIRLDSVLISAAQGLYDRAVSYHDQRQYDRAEPLYERALEIRERVLGKEHLDVAEIQLDLASVYAAQGQYDRAKPLYERALEIREKVLGKEHPDVAEIQLDLALVSAAQGLYERAEPLYERAKTDEEHLFLDPTRSTVNSSLIARSNFLSFRKKLVHTGYVNAEQINQALVDSRRTNRKSSIEVAVSYHDQGRYERAEILYERAKTHEEHLFRDPTRPSFPKRALIVRTDFSPFDNKLIQSGYVNAEQLKQALVDSRANNHPLTEVLEALTGKRLPIELKKIYKKQRLFELKIVCGIDAVDIESTKISKVEICKLISKFISVDSCRQLKLLPICIADGNPPMLTVAMINPGDLQAKNNLDKVLRRHSIGWRAQVITPEDYQYLLDSYLYERRQEDAGITLYDLAVSYIEQGLYERAEPLYKCALEIWEKFLGKEHPDVDNIRLDLALVYATQGLYKRAEPLYERVLEIREKALGKEHPDVADILLYLASIYKEQGLHTRAESLYERALEIREKALGKEHPDVADILLALASIYKEQEPYYRAEALYERALEIREKLLGKEHPDVADILLALASIYKKQRLYDRAEPLLKLTLLMREKVLGTEHLDVAMTLYNLAGLYKEQELYDRAEPLYRLALEIQEKLPDKEHLDVATTLNQLAELYRQQGLYERSQPLYERVLGLREKALGKEHLDLASTLNELAFLSQQQGLFTRAESLYRRALAIQEKALGQEHLDAAKTLHGLAGLYQRQGLYDRAEPLYQQALQISKAALGTEHPDIAVIFHGWAGLYKEQGIYERAEPLYQRALEISKKTLGEEHPHVAATLHHLAGLYQAQGLYERAEPLYQEDLEISKKTLGDDHIDVATTLHHLADLYQVQGLPERAEPLYQQALEIREKALGKKHPDVANTLNSLAGLYQARGAYNEAEPRYKRALEIQETTLGKKHPDVANTLNDLAGLYRVQGLYSMSSEPMYKRALGIKEAALGQDHPSVATTLHHLAAMYREQERYDLALAQFQAALESQYNFIRKRLAHISEREHKLYLKDLKRTLQALLSLVCRHLNTDQSAIAIALNAVLLTKNLSAAALAARNASVHSGNPQLQTKIQQIRELIAQSNHLAHDDPQQIQIREQMRALEIQIARIAPEVMLPDALEIDRQAITQKLTLDITLVEFIGFDLDNSTRYLAFVYSPNRSNRIRLIDLGLASEIDPLIASCRKSIQNIYKSVKKAGSRAPKKIGDFPLDNLAPIQTRIIDPLHLDGVAHAIIAPDGALSFLPFQLFLPDSLVSYLNTGRDLVKKPSQKPMGDSIVIADPDFVNKPTELHLVPSRPQIESDGVRVAGVKDLNNWIPLDSFGILGTAIAAKLRVACHQQQFATKAKLTQSPCPHILSILTHGFALPKTDVDELDPMARSGLAFAGANHGTEYLLLANEVATLDLHNNELTLLVACQTALGDVTTGEGVYGLRRAFALAGAKTLIATLWEIPVYASVILIERLLDNLERSMGKAAALKEAQMYLRDIDVATLDRIPNGAGLDALTELHGKNHDLDDAFQPFSHPYFWAAWICQGDTGAMKYVIAKDFGKFTVSGKVINLRIQK